MARMPRAVSSRAHLADFDVHVHATEATHFAAVEQVAQGDQSRGLAGLARRVQHEVLLGADQAQELANVPPGPAARWRSGSSGRTGPAVLKKRMGRLWHLLRAVACAGRPTARQDGTGIRDRAARPGVRRPSRPRPMTSPAIPPPTRPASRQDTIDQSVECGLHLRPEVRLHPVHVPELGEGPAAERAQAVHPGQPRRSPSPPSSPSRPRAGSP